MDVPIRVDATPSLATASILSRQRRVARISRLHLAGNGCGEPRSGFLNRLDTSGEPQRSPRASQLLSVLQSYTSSRMRAQSMNIDARGLNECADRYVPQGSMLAGRSLHQPPEPGR